MARFFNIITQTDPFTSNGITAFLGSSDRYKTHVNRSSLYSIDVPTRTNEIFAIKYVIAGEERYEVDGVQQRVRPGEFLFVNPGQDVSVGFQSRRLAVGLCLYVSPQDLSSAMSALALPDADKLAQQDASLPVEELPQGIFTAQHSPFGNFLAQVAKNTTENPEIEPEDMQQELSFALAGFQAEQIQAYRKLPAERPSTKAELFRRLLRARDCLHDRFAEKLTLAELAREASLSEFHFSRSFKRLFGQSPHRYLIDLRLQKAATTLSTKGRSVGEVALQCGFSDIHAFSKAFKKKFGAPPSKFIR